MPEITIDLETLQKWVDEEIQIAYEQGNEKVAKGISGAYHVGVQMGLLMVMKYLEKLAEQESQNA